MATRRAGAVLVVAAGRGLFEGEEARPGRSDLAYIQHKYSPLDSRIIIITAAILLFLIAILFLNFCIRWALRRFFLARSDPKPVNLNKGLSKRQIEALPSFIYSSSKPLHLAPPPCGHPIFYGPFTLNPISSHLSHALYPSSKTSPNVGAIDHRAPTTQLKVDLKGNFNTPSQLPSPPVQKVVTDEPPAKVLSLEGNSLVSTHVDVVVETDPPTKAGFLGVDRALDGTYTLIQTGEVVNNACTTKANLQSSHNEVEGDVTIDCTKDGEMTKQCHDTPNSSSPCPICLVEFADGETIRVLPVCQHYFHIGCIDLWLTKSSSCPACRANLLDVTRSTTNQSPLQVQIVTTTPHN